MAVSVLFSLPSSVSFSGRIFSDFHHRQDILLNVFLAIAVDNLAGGDCDDTKKE